MLKDIRGNVIKLEIIIFCGGLIVAGLSVLNTWNILINLWIYIFKVYIHPRWRDKIYITQLSHFKRQYWIMETCRGKGQDETLNWINWFIPVPVLSVLYHSTQYVTFSPVSYRNWRLISRSYYFSLGNGFLDIFWAYRECLYLGSGVEFLNYEYRCAACRGDWAKTRLDTSAPV